MTGTSRGLGEAIARRFLSLGANVIGVARRGASIEESSYRHLIADMTETGSAATVAREAQRAWGRLDVVVNNIGAARMNPILLTPDPLVRDLMRINYEATFAMCREAVRQMQRRRYGRIINLSSVAVPMALEGEAAYASAKAAVETLTRILAREVAAYGITCNVVAPAPVPTDLIRNVPPAAIERLTDRLALRRTCTPEEVAYAVTALAHRDASGITGQVLYLGGPA